MSFLADVDEDGCTVGLGRVKEALEVYGACNLLKIDCDGDGDRCVNGPT